MKIKNLRLRNYKRFVEETQFSFCDLEGDANEITLLVGENGSGKSSILQAIAMVVGGAVYPDFRPSELDWPGFRYDSIQNGRMPVHAEAELHFSDEESKATAAFAQELGEIYPDRTYLAGQKEKIELRFSFDKDSVVSDTATDFYQTHGYQYARQLSKYKQDTASLFESVGTLLFYHEQRHTTSISTSINGESTREQLSDKHLKQILDGFYRFDWQVQNNKDFELRPGQRNIYRELAENYEHIFSPRRFVGSAPQMRPEKILDAPDFIISDGTNQYDISEMSAGERAIFPLLIDFSNWNINNSIILIDEIELHLHPPLQQALVRALPKLGKNNQFIITTHSNFVASMFLDHQIIRL